MRAYGGAMRYRRNAIRWLSPPVARGRHAPFLVQVKNVDHCHRFLRGKSVKVGSVLRQNPVSGVQYWLWSGDAAMA